MKRLTLVAVVGAVALPAWAELVDRVAAVVNGAVITLSDVEARAAGELQRVTAEPNPQKRGEARRKLYEKALDVLIGEKLLEGQIRDLGIDVSDAELEAGIDDVKRQNGLDSDGFEKALAQEGYSLTSYKDFMRKYMARMKLVNLKVRSRVKVSEEDLKAEYARVVRDEAQDAEVRVRHILVQLAPKATAQQVEAARVKAEGLAAEAQKPGVDFAALAKAKSDGPSAGDGGDLGFFRRGVMEPGFDKTAFALKVGEVSAPVRSKLGWHVLKLEERRALDAAPYEKAKDALREKLMRTQLEKLTDQYVQELRAGAAVEVKL